MSNMDITERRMPQDGRFKIEFEKKDIDFRVRHNDGGSVDLTIVDANISVVMVGGT